MINRKEKKTSIVSRLENFEGFDVETYGKFSDLPNHISIEFCISTGIKTRANLVLIIKSPVFLQATVDMLKRIIESEAEILSKYNGQI